MSRISGSDQVASGSSAYHRRNPTQHAACRIFVASHQRGPYRDPNMKELGQYNLTDSVVSCSCEETFQGQVANFVLVPKKPWQELLYPGDWVSIYFSSGATSPSGFGVYRDPESEAESIRVFFGFIDAVRTSVSVATEGGTTVRISVSCSGINKAFDRTSIYYNPVLGSQSRFGSLLPGMADLMRNIPLRGTPTTMPRGIALSFLGYGGQFLLPDSYPKGVGTPAERQSRLFKYFQSALSIEEVLGIAKVRGTGGNEQNLIAQLIKKGKQNFSINSIASLIDFFGYVEDVAVDGITDKTPFHDLTGSVWANMQEFCNPIMNECFFSLRPEKDNVTGQKVLSGSAAGADEWGQRPRYVPALVIRERPFGWHDWVFEVPLKSQSKPIRFRFGNVFFSRSDKPAEVEPLQQVNSSGILFDHARMFGRVNRFVERVNLRSEDIYSETLGMSDNDHYNFWMISSSNMVLGPDQQKFTLLQDGLIPIFLPESIKRYGLRTREMATKFMFSGAQNPDSRKIQTFLLRCLLAQDYWYQHAPWYRAGTISGRAIPKARVGMVLDVSGPSREESFYLEGVAFEWTHSTEGAGRLLATYTVTRGQPSGFADSRKRFHYAPPDAVKVYMVNTGGGLTLRQRAVSSNQPAPVLSSGQRQAANPGVRQSSYPAPTGPISIQLSNPLPSNLAIGVGIDYGNVPRYPGGFHTGIDQHAPLGNPVLAALGGKVIFTGSAGDYGLRVDLDHGNGLFTTYGHLDKIDVQVGQSVVQGAQLGGVGKTGHAVGVHLHFEVRYGANTQKHVIDPMNYIVPRPIYYSGVRLRTSTPVTDGDRALQAAQSQSQSQQKTKTKVAGGDAVGLEHEKVIRDALIQTGGDVAKAMEVIEQKIGDNVVDTQDVQDVKSTMEKSADGQKIKQQQAVLRLSDVQLTEKIRKLIDVVARSESRGDYGAINKDDVGSGVSLGIIQFNQRAGTLPQLFEETNRRDPAKFQQVFGPYVQTLLDRALLRRDRYILSGNPPSKNTDVLKRFRDSARAEVSFQQVQLDLARQYYFDPCIPVAKEFGLKSERAFAMMFDIAVQFGITGRRGLRDQVGIAVKQVKERLKREDVTELQILEQLWQVSDEYGQQKVEKMIGRRVRRPFRRERIYLSASLSDADFFVGGVPSPSAPAQGAALVRTTVSGLARSLSATQKVQYLDRQRAGSPPWVEQPELAGAMFDPVRRGNVANNFSSIERTLKNAVEKGSK